MSVAIKDMTLAEMLGLSMAQVAVTEPSNMFAPLKDGDYYLEVKRSEVKRTKTGSGLLISVAFATPSGKWIWSNFNIFNASAEAQRIGREQFAECLKALGMNASEVSTEADFAKLVGKKLVGTVRTKDGENVIRQYKPVEDRVPLDAYEGDLF